MLASEVVMEGMSVDELCQYIFIKVPDLDESVLDNIRLHKIDGSVFLQLNEEYLREVAPLLGDRVRLRRVISSSVEPDGYDSSSTTEISTPVSKPPPQPPIRMRHPKRLNPSPSPPPDFSDATESPASSAKDSISQLSDSTCTSSSSSDWVKNLTIPTRFSKTTMNCIDIGILTNHARDEIINSLSTCILLYTVTPTAEERRQVCQRLVKTHPSLQDSLGSGYDSWAKKLSDKFKNLHRSDRADKAGITLKKKKLYDDEEEKESLSSSRQEVYDRHNNKLLSDYSSGKWSLPSMSSLMVETYKKRRQYLKANLSVKDALEQFPWLKEPAVILKEFSLVTGKDPNKFQSNWKSIEDKILKYAEMEGKKKVKSVMKLYDPYSTENTPDRKTTYALLALSSLLRQSSDLFFLPVEGEVIDIEREILSIAERHKHPLVVAFGKDINTLTDFVVLAEKGTVIHTPTLSVALHCAFALYYIFDIAYPKSCKNQMMFLELSVYGMKPSATISTTVTVLMDTITKM